MFILRDILSPLKGTFSSTPLGVQRSQWFVYSLMAFILPFTSSISSNILRCLETLFGLKIGKRRFYIFMASNKLPWRKLWHQLWNSIPNPSTNGHLVVLDDFINPKTGKKIFGCSYIFDHTAKTNQTKYPWTQNLLSVGLLKYIKWRWACLPLACRFYLPKKEIQSKSQNMQVPGKPTVFRIKKVKGRNSFAFSDLRHIISTLHLDSYSKKQEFDERYLGCGFPALEIISIFNLATIQFYC